MAVVLRLCWKHCASIGAFLLATLGAVLVFPGSSAAAAISVTPFPATQTIFEGQSGSVDFLVSNTLTTDNVRITRIISSTSCPDIGNDPDCLNGPSRGPDLCTGALLAPSGTCVFVIDFDSVGSDEGTEDQDTVMNTVDTSVFFVDPTGTSGQVNGSAVVFVSDVPEPRSLNLITVALMLLGLWRCRIRFTGCIARLWDHQPLRS